MFGVRIWHDSDCALLDDDVWQEMKAAIRVTRAQRPK